MRAAGALPSEERVKKMNDQQWLWYYLNVQKDEEEEEQRWKTRLDYMGWWANPELAKSVADHEQFKNSNVKEEKGDTTVGDEIVVQGDTAMSSDFEEELRNALKESGMEEAEFTELPDSHNVGNPNESLDIFLSKVRQSQEMNFDIVDENDLEDSLIEMGIDPNDLDYFEEDEKEE